MTFEENKSLKEFNTFGVDVKAKYFIQVSSTSKLLEVLESDKAIDYMILGGGSNMLLTQDIDKLVIQLNTKGIQEEHLSDTHVIIEAQAGENWHDLVQYCVAKNYGGIENLSLIPGNAGTAPIQNIGAYGVELKDVLHACKVWDTHEECIIEINNAACEFDYRDSIFKSKEKGRYIILAIQLKLSKKEHEIRTSYGAIQEELKTAAVKKPSIADIAQAVIRIRSSKLPNPKELGNGGSFFKNPVLNEKAFQVFRDQHNEAPFYKVAEGYKIPAGWLIDHAGLKGYRKGDAGVHKNQALVLVNYGEATGKEILELSKFIQKTVKDKYGIEIVPEINIY